MGGQGGTLACTCTAKQKQCSKFGTWISHGLHLQTESEDWTGNGSKIDTKPSNIPAFLLPWPYPALPCRFSEQGVGVLTHSSWLVGSISSWMEQGLTSEYQCIGQSTKKPGMLWTSMCIWFFRCLDCRQSSLSNSTVPWKQCLYHLFTELMDVFDLLWK